MLLKWQATSLPFRKFKQSKFEISAESDTLRIDNRGTHKLVAVPERAQDAFIQISMYVRTRNEVRMGSSRRTAGCIYVELFYIAFALYGSLLLHKFVMTVQDKQLLHASYQLALLACLPVCRTVSTATMQDFVKYSSSRSRGSRGVTAYRIRGLVVRRECST